MLLLAEIQKYPRISTIIRKGRRGRAILWNLDALRKVGRPRITLKNVLEVDLEGFDQTRLPAEFNHINKRRKIN